MFVHFIAEFCFGWLPRLFHVTTNLSPVIMLIPATSKPQRLETKQIKSSIINHVVEGVANSRSHDVIKQ